MCFCFLLDKFSLCYSSLHLTAEVLRFVVLNPEMMPNFVNDFFKITESDAKLEPPILWPIVVEELTTKRPDAKGLKQI